MAKRKPRSKKLHYAPWEPDSWLSSAKVALMTPLEQAAYRNLLDRQWMDETQSIPADPDDALALCPGKNPIGYIEVVRTVLSTCFEADPELPHRVFNLKHREKFFEATKNYQSRSSAASKWQKEKKNKKIDAPLSEHSIPTEQPQVHLVLDLTSKEEKKEMDTPPGFSPVVSGCSWFRASESELTMAREHYQLQGYPAGWFDHAVVEVENWLSGQTSEAKSARQEPTHARKLYTSWALKLARARAEVSAPDKRHVAVADQNFANLFELEMSEGFK